MSRDHNLQVKASVSSYLTLFYKCIAKTTIVSFLFPSRFSIIAQVETVSPLLQSVFNLSQFHWNLRKTQINVTNAEGRNKLINKMSIQQMVDFYDKTEYYSQLFTEIMHLAQQLSIKKTNNTKIMINFYSYVFLDRKERHVLHKKVYQSISKFQVRRHIRQIKVHHIHVRVMRQQMLWQTNQQMIILILIKVLLPKLLYQITKLLELFGLIFMTTIISLLSL